MLETPWVGSMGTETERLSTELSESEEGRIVEDLLSKLYVLIRTARSHERANSAMGDSAQALHAVIYGILDEHEVLQLDVASDCVFFNRMRLRPRVAGFNTIKYFVYETKRREIGSISFDETVEVDDLLSFAMVFARTETAAPNPFQEFARQMQLEGIAGIGVKPIGQVADEALHEPQPVPTKEEAKRSFFSALHIVKEAVQEGVAKGKVNPRKVKRVVESVVDSILSDEESMMALTAIRDYDEYTYHHSFNVCIYSIALGNRLGLPKQALCEIGIAALFHDVGKTDVPHEILNKMENLTEADWGTIQEHTMSGVKVLTYLRKMDRAILRSIIVAFCHHLNTDRSGYPQTKTPVKPDAFSRIVRIADVYDALTSGRSYRMRPFSRSDALAIITDKAGKELDPTMCAIFADVIGEMPEGAPPPSCLSDLAGPRPGVAVTCEGEQGQKHETWDFVSDDPIIDNDTEEDAGDKFQIGKPGATKSSPLDACIEGESHHS